MQGISRDHTTPYTKVDECHECGEKIEKGESIQYLRVFDDPWAVKSCHVVLHDDNDEDGHGSCLEKLFDESWADFRYFECSACQRIIVKQCLDNGWRSYVKEYAGKEICVKCYQEKILEVGHQIADLQSKIPGDFFNDKDLNAFQWSLVPGCNGVHINSRESVKSILTRARALVMQKHKVLFNYNSMGIGGGEGYVSLYVKSISDIQNRRV